jgi:AraC-like DNA-binding protein
MQPYFALRMHRSRDRAELVYTPVAALSHRAMRVLEEAIVLADHSGFVSTLRDRLPPYEVWMSIERPPHASRYQDLLNVKAHFADPVPGVRIALPAMLLDAPLAMANPRAMRAAEDRCKTILRGANVRRRWSEWCRTMLRESEDSRPTLGQLARFMNISPRTLARYLESEGASFRELSLEVRTARARQLLADGAASVTQIAYRLGYTDVASFIRSFKARTGQAPGALRRVAKTACHAPGIPVGPARQPAAPSAAAAPRRRLP